MQLNVCTDMYLSVHICIIDMFRFVQANADLHLLYRSVHTCTDMYIYRENRENMKNRETRENRENMENSENRETPPRETDPPERRGSWGREGVEENVGRERVREIV